MRTVFSFRTLVIIFIFVCFPAFLWAQPTNDNCAGVITVTSSTTCATTLYNIKNATNAAPTGTCGGATATTTYDMWFRFQANSTSPAITLSNFGANLTSGTTYIQVLSGAACGGFTSLACGTSRLNLTGLTVGTFYYLRIYVTTNPNGTGGTNKYDFEM